jgi:hypothetical protein
MLITFWASRTPRCRGRVERWSLDARLVADPTLAGAPRSFGMRLNFDGDYVEASALLNDLLRAGVQVVSFVERADSLEAMFEEVRDGAR